jgi:hypothetical protein
MIESKFKGLFRSGAYNSPVEFPSVSVALGQHTLSLRFDSKDICLLAGYDGVLHPWLSALCYLIEGKSLSELMRLSLKEFTEVFRDDQDFWDLYQEESESFFFPPLELLHAALAMYRGRDYLYRPTSPLVCRCFGVREREILDHLKMEPLPTLETLANFSKAGMGCRSCVGELKRCLVVEGEGKSPRYFKNRPVADWLLEIDHRLSSFPKSVEWKMEVLSLKGHQVIISFEKEVGQTEEEQVGKELQGFLAASVDPDLGFFLRRSRHLSKARG